MAGRSREVRRERRHLRVRKKVTGTRERPRLNVYRSLSGIYAQVIDDVAGQTLASASTLDGKLKAELSGLSKTDQARLVGRLIGERAQARGVREVVFDRGGYRYQGRVRALAEGARGAGLVF